MSDTTKLDKMVQNPLANGLAILIGCKECFRPNSRVLTGVKHDLDQLNATFSALKFETLSLMDRSADEIIDVLQHAAKLMLLSTYRRLVVTFSGHGDGKSLFAKDRSMLLWDDIVKPLISTNPTIAKLFFVDACRGPGVSYGVPVNPYNLRGEEQTIRVLEKTNYLVAYSTLLGMGAMEDPHHGSFWMQILTPMLLDDHYVEKTIFDIVTSVNEKMNKRLNDLGLPIQQPALYSCLNVDVRLLKEAKAIQPGYDQQDAARALTASHCDQESPLQSNLQRLGSSLPPQGHQLLDRRIKGKYHDRIASRISNWKKLARSFEFKVDDFDDELKKAEKIVKLLERWQQEEAENATFEALAKALENIEYPDDARQIRDLAMTVT